VFEIRKKGNKEKKCVALLRHKMLLVSQLTKSVAVNLCSVRRAYMPVCLYCKQRSPPSAVGLLLQPAVLAQVINR